MRLYRFRILSYKSLYNFGLKSYQNCPFDPQKGFFAELHLSDFYQLLETYHAAKSEKKKSFRLILRLKLIFNAVLQNNEILDSNYNWSQLAFLEAYYIKNHDSIMNHGLKSSKSLLLLNQPLNIDFYFKLLINISMTTLQLSNLYIFLLNNFHLILPQLQCRYYIKIYQSFYFHILFLRSYFGLNKMLIK